MIILKTAMDYRIQTTSKFTARRCACSQIKILSSQKKRKTTEFEFTKLYFI